MGFSAIFGQKPAAGSELNCEPLFRGFGTNRLKKFPRKQRRECGDVYFPVKELADFELSISRGLGHVKVRRGALLMQSQGTYRLAGFFLPLLRDPPPGLRFLLRTLRELSGKDKVEIVLETRIGRGPAGWFRARRRHETIHLVDTLSRGRSEQAEFRTMDTATLYHELGHSLMHHLYGGKIPDYRGSSGHDPLAQRHWEAETNPAAAWAEGFAGAMANLDFHSSKNLHGPDDLPPAWFGKKFLARLSNEYVIAAVLTDYVKSVISVRDSATTTEVFDAASLARLKKILAVMRSRGLQEDFGVFVRDFLAGYPGEAKRLLPILWNYGLREAAGAVRG